MTDKSTGSSETATPQTTTPVIGYGHPEYHFIQAIMELQKSIGELTATVQLLSKSVDSTKTKVDELIKWKNMIVGGAIVLGVVLGTIVTIGTKVLM